MVLLDLSEEKRPNSSRYGVSSLLDILRFAAFISVNPSSMRLWIRCSEFLIFTPLYSVFMITATADKIHDEYKLVVESAFYNHSEN